MEDQAVGLGLPRNIWRRWPLRMSCAQAFASREKWSFEMINKTAGWILQFGSAPEVEVVWVKKQQRRMAPTDEHKQ